MALGRICLLTALLGLVFACQRSGAPSASDEGAVEPATRVMPLGDSITEGSDGAVTWRYHLEKKLVAAGLRVDYVGSRRGVQRGRPRFDDFDADHEGHWGWTSGEVRARIDEWARSARPDVVLLHLGTNDLGGDPAAIATNLAAIVDALRAANPNVAILVARLIPVAGVPRPILDSARDATERMAREKTTVRSPIVVVRQDEGFDVARDTYDGIHPNDAGERKMADRWFEALRPLLAKPRAGSFP